MNAFQLFKAEMGKLAEKKTVLISVVLMLLVPLTYAAILLSSKAGPRDNIDNLPVAVVNNDKGAELNGSQIQVGDDLVKELKASKTLGWEFVTSEEADRGIKNNKYYMVVEIPADFSKNVTSVLEPSPKKAQLKFRQNEGLHFMGATVTDSAIETIKAQLNTKVTETYTKTLFAQLGQVNEGFKEAADGSKQINDGSGQLKDGTGQILASLNEKSADIAKLADGAKQLNAGTGELLNNLKGKSGDINKLATGAQELNSGTAQLVQALTDQQGDVAKLINGAKTLETGANTLNAGAGEVLNGLKGAKVGSEKLYAGLTQQLIPGSQQLAAGVAEAKKGVEDSINQMKELRDGLLQLNQAVPEGLPIKQPLNQMITKLNQSLADEVVNAKQAKLEQLKLGAEKLRDGLDVEKGDFGIGLVSLNSGLSALVAGQTKVSEGANQLAQGATQVSLGNQKLVGTLTTNAQKLHAGTTQIKDGNAQVASGWSQLTAGATKLHDGSNQISNGNQSVKEGWTQLTDGVTQVDEGLLKLKDGSSELMTGLQSGAESTEQLKVSDNNIKMFAEPVDVDSEVLNAYPYYRDSNAPYILSLALFVGVLIMSLVVSFDKPTVTPASGIALFAGKTLKLGVLTIIQAVVLSLFVLFGLGMHVENGIMLILFSIFVSLTFLMIVLFLVAAAGNIGRFIALAFILLQVQTTGTSLPIDMLPESIRTLSNFLPLTYSIDAFRNIIILGDLGSVFADMFILLIYLAVSAVLASIVFAVKYKNHADTPNEQLELTT